MIWKKKCFGYSNRMTHEQWRKKWQHILTIHFPNSIEMKQLLIRGRCQNQRATSIVQQRLTDANISNDDFNLQKKKLYWPIAECEYMLHTSWHQSRSAYIHSNWCHFYNVHNHWQWCVALIIRIPFQFENQSIHFKITALHSFYHLYRW